jgi:hypothetical protein
VHNTVPKLILAGGVGSMFREPSLGKGSCSVGPPHRLSRGLGILCWLERCVGVFGTSVRSESIMWGWLLIGDLSRLLFVSENFRRESVESTERPENGSSVGLTFKKFKLCSTA